MLQFKDIELTDKEWVCELLSYSDYNSTEYNFTVLFLWKHYYNTKICRYKDYLLIKSTPSWAETSQYILPAGKGSEEDFKEVMELYREDAQASGSPLKIFSVLPLQKTLLENLYPGKFEYTPLRDSFDYIYNAADLLFLRGKKFQSKRNFINRFKNGHNWSYEPITVANIDECLQMNRDWCAQYGNCADGHTLEAEACTVAMALKNFEALNLSGGLLRVENRVVGFTLAERLNSDTLLVHIEKAYASVAGAYPTVANEFLKAELLNGKEGVADSVTLPYTYINREDDAGDLGLREAKMQYNPAFLLEKFLVTEI